MLTRPASTSGSRGEDRLDQPDTGAALQAVDRQDEFVRAVGRVVMKRDEVATLGRFGAWCAKAGSRMRCA